MTGEQRDCFAYDETRVKRGGCLALKEWGGKYGTRCIDCPFYKTRVQFERELKKYSTKKETIKCIG